MSTSGPRRVVITGSGMLTALGVAPDEVFEALERGASAVAPLPAELVRGIGELSGAPLPAPGPEAYLGDRNLRPLDRTGRLTAAAAELALESSRWVREETGRMGLVLGTMFGSLRTISEFDRRGLTAGPAYTKPFDFANTVINAAAGQAAIWHGLAGINATVTGGITAGLQAVAYAAELIRAGRADALLAGGAEELCPEALQGFSRAGFLTPNGRPPVPLHRRRDGFALGEGAALLALEEAATATARGAVAQAEILGLGNAFDRSRGRGEGAANAMARAVREALLDAGLQARDIDVLAVSANGGPCLDRWEAQGVAGALGERAADLPVLAFKGQLGECLGASGALQVALLAEALGRGRVPAIPGLDERDPELPLPGATHMASGSLPESSAGATHLSEGRRTGLVTALGLDGNACAVVIAARLERNPR